MSSVHPISIGYTDGMLSERDADGLPWVRGQSASVRKNSPEAVQVGGLSKFSKADGPPEVTEGPRLRRTGGVARLDLYGVLLSSPTTKPTTFNHKLSLSFSLKHVGETSRSRAFGMIPGRSEDIPGLFSTISIMSSQYFVKSLTLVLRFHRWKELGLGVSIYFWAMDS